MNNRYEELKSELISSENKEEVFDKIPKKDKGAILINLPIKIQEDVLINLTDDEIANFLKFLDLDEATDILQVLERDRRVEILEKLEKDARDKIQFLLKFEKESAAGLMSLDYIIVESDFKLKDALKQAKKHEKETGKFPVILVAKDSILQGELETYKIPKIKQYEIIGSYSKRIPEILYNTDSKEIPKILRSHSHDKLVVIDEDKCVLGIIYAHDVLKLMDHSNDIGKFAGVSREEDVYDNFIEKTKYRYKWLIINLATAFFAASIVGLFEETISKFVLLAVYMPIVAGMGGNAGTQTLAIFVRGISLNEISLNKNAVKVVLNEVFAGIFNGLITGILAAGVAIFWNKSPLLGVIIGFAMVINLAIAGLFGAIIPLAMKKLGKDPATSATIFITTATDVLGFLVFLGLASLLL